MRHDDRMTEMVRLAAFLLDAGEAEVWELPWGATMEYLDAFAKFAALHHALGGAAVHNRLAGFPIPVGGAWVDNARDVLIKKN